MITFATARKSTIVQDNIRKDTKNDKHHKTQHGTIHNDKEAEQNFTTIDIPDDCSPTPVSYIGTWNVPKPEPESTIVTLPTLYTTHGNVITSSNTITRYPNTITTSSNSAFKNVQSSTKISPSSIPNPNPSVSANKSSDTSNSNYPTYGGYLYSIPGYSAFQPLQYPSINILGGTDCAQGVPMTTIASEPPNTSDYIQLTSSNNVDNVLKDDTTTCSDEQLKLVGKNIESELKNEVKNDTDIVQTDFEEHFRTEIVPTVNNVRQEAVISGKDYTHKDKSADVVIQSKETISVVNLKQKTERFSLMTSIPISKIDMKSVLPPDGIIQSVYHLQTLPHEDIKPEQGSKVTIRSNILIRRDATTLPQNTGYVSTEMKQAEEIVTPGCSTPENGSTAYENKQPTASHTQDIGPEMQNDVIPTSDEMLTLPLLAMQQLSAPASQLETNSQMINVIKKTETNTTKQLVLIPNRTTTNQKLLLAISQSQTKANQLILKKTTTPESKNQQAPSRPSNVNKKVKDTLLLAEPLPQTRAHKVVALKRLHQDNGDEDDFENLITENQIYGNKIVVKERSHGIVLQEQVKSAFINLQPNTVGSSDNNTFVGEPNGYLKPSFVYLSNLPIPTNMGNIMLINRSPPIYAPLQNTNAAKNDRSVTDILENNVPKTNYSNTNFCQADALRNTKSPASNLKLTQANENLITINGKDAPNIYSKDISFGAEVLLRPMTPNIVGIRQLYRAPVVQLNFDRTLPRKVGRPLKSKEIPNLILSNSENMNADKLIPLKIHADPNKTIEHDNLTISHSFNNFSQEKNVSIIDLAEKKRKLRRLKHQVYRDMGKDFSKNKGDKSESFKNGKVNIALELQKEFVKAQGRHRNTSESQDSDSDIEETADHDFIQELCGQKKETKPLNTAQGKLGFLKVFGLTTQTKRNEMELKILERRSKLENVTSAITVDLDCVIELAGERVSALLESKRVKRFSLSPPQALERELNIENRYRLGDKVSFFSQLQLAGVSRKYKEDYEETWKVIIDERKKRSGESPFTKYCDHSYSKWKESRNSVAINTHARGQLQIMNEITRSVNENNNLIKKRLDGQLFITPANEFDSDVIIPILAEQNITGLDKLSKMADNCLKIFVGPEHVRHSQPVLDASIHKVGDSELQNKSTDLPTKPEINHQKITIPSVAKVISLSLSLNDPSMMDTSPATSMDEPQNSAALVKSDSEKVLTYESMLPANKSASPQFYYISDVDTSKHFTPVEAGESVTIGNSTRIDRNIDNSFNNYLVDKSVIVCPKDNTEKIFNSSIDQWRWPGIEIVMESYRKYDAECHHERFTLISENNRLKREVAARRVEVTATNDTIRRLFAEKQSALLKHDRLQKSVAKIMNVIDFIKQTCKKDTQ